MIAGRVLVTGATGLIGRHVVSSLIARGAEVHAVARSPAPTDGEVRWHNADFLDDRDRIRLLDAAEPQSVVHCAWVTEHGGFWTSPKNLDWAAATLSFAREARERGTQRLVGLGTCAEYDWTTGEPLTENKTPLKPATLYGSAKDATRRLLEAFARASGLSFAWPRVAMLYGAGEHKDRFVASLARALVRGEPATMSSGKVTRDFLDARDVGAAIAAVAQSPLTGAINIGSGKPVSLLQVGETLARLAAAPDLLKPGALPDRADEPGTLAVDVTRLANEAGFRPCVSLEQGLRDALAYWRTKEQT